MGAEVPTPGAVASSAGGLRQQMRGDDIDELAGRDDLGFLSEFWKMALVVDYEIVNAALRPPISVLHLEDLEPLCYMRATVTAHLRLPRRSLLQFRVFLVLLRAVILTLTGNRTS